MILLCGIPSETSLAIAVREVERLGVDHVVFNQRQFASMALEFELAAGEVDGALRVGDSVYPLRELSGVYTRLMDDRFLPELREEPADSPLRAHCRRLHETLTRWFEIAPGRVVNRSRPQGSNGSKPYQAQLIARHGFSIPETLISNEPELVREFVAAHPRVIYKSISGVRSIVQTFGEDDLERLELIRWCPVQFQAHVPGTDVRAHVIGEEVIATAVSSEATDYRYAARQSGRGAEMRAVELPDEVAERCVELAADLELPFAGIDLRITPEDEVFCFEVNPSPAFSYYESITEQPIGHSLARYLAAG
ncbi:MAG TPA: hypothetical protein VGI73_11990 [Solirubrobacterales bacterium]|jgi:hypothetical protein